VIHDFLYGLAFNLLLELIFDKPAFHGPPLQPPQPAVTINLGLNAQVSIPEWVTNISRGCFVGISQPCESIAEARQQAVNSAISQILQAMGSEYSLKHQSTIGGNIHHSHHELRERLSYTSKWLVHSIQQEIRESSIQQIEEKYICFVLIHFPSSKITAMRKLTIGPKIGAKIVQKNDDHVVISAKETNTFTWKSVMQ
jgi:hypothetical protein